MIRVLSKVIKLMYMPEAPVKKQSDNTTHIIDNVITKQYWIDYGICVCIRGVFGCVRRGFTGMVCCLLGCGCVGEKGYGWGLCM